MLPVLTLQKLEDRVLAYLEENAKNVRCIDI